MIPTSEDPCNSHFEKTVLVIFGVTGDLTFRKLIPALFQLWRNEKISNEFSIIGFARRDWTDIQLKKVFTESIKENADFCDYEKLKTFISCTKYIQSDFDELSGYLKLEKEFKAINAINVIYYLATPPDSYIEIINNIGRINIEQRIKGWTRIIVEKPYGNGRESAEILETKIHQVFEEDQIYRIDHYLGKETVQNILVFRFANGIFEPLWNRHYIDNIQITVAETVGVGLRAGYYERAGVIRDMFQNHLLQLVCLTGMEAPISFNAEAVRDEKMKVLKSLKPLSRNGNVQFVRGQYSDGKIDNDFAIGYKKEQNVFSNSITETYIAARLFIENWRWAGVPFYIRSGKRLPKRLTEIAIQFKQVPLPLFDWKNIAGDAPNVLVIRIQPNEGIDLSIGAKKPGPVNQIAPVNLDFSYEEAFGVQPPDAYERLLLDCIYGDATLFTRSDEVKAQWSFTSSILELWESEHKRILPQYPAGTWGPKEAEELVANDGKKWRFG